MACESGSTDSYARDAAIGFIAVEKLVRVSLTGSTRGRFRLASWRWDLFRRPDRNNYGVDHVRVLLRFLAWTIPPGYRMTAVLR